MSVVSKFKLKQVALGLVGLLVLFLLGTWVYTTFLESDEAKVRKVMAEVAEGAKERNPRTITSLLTKSFRVKYQGYLGDVTDVHQALMRILLVEYKFGFEVTMAPDPIPVTVAEDGKTAEARLTGLSARGKANKDGDWIKIRPRVARGDVEWTITFHKREEGWRIHRIDFGSLAPRPPGQPEETGAD